MPKRSLEDMDENELAEKVAQRCYSLFSSLPKTGKPTEHEWTHLSCVVCVNDAGQIDVLSLGTGTKCLGKDQRCSKGLLIQDQHAEVIARRCFLKYLYKQIDLFKSIKKSDIITSVCEHSKKFVINSLLKFYLFTSHTPCGEASILTDDVKKCKFNNPTKCLSKENGLYLKPGKGYQTDSLSCTNKIRRWLQLGIEGCLLSQLLSTPLYLDGIIIGKCSARNMDTLECLFSPCQILFSNSQFEYSPEAVSENSKSCSNSIGWISDVESFVTTDGYLLGKTKKARLVEKHSPPISKYALFKSFLRLKQLNNFSTYAEAKLACKDYNVRRQQFMIKNPSWIQTNPQQYYQIKIEDDEK
ncbi:unnamed protein product [Didymodactylos carnosus]|uniref:tRNA-specific adenosine deaminase 1 n=1 Tax=Didymodactylos carnosus TaxID=1234261 RepID=A0A814EEE5_9BILA|nr:unnamed protein product [Didymodactylos carnosus]CAF1159256.1 unnamed protein product [Didymodactylos carnosus]CAF3742974.1 unnamed protein product [Didymodactylos carnosus]CAF3970884.1 unnamed protein product [Didymodactylos carnosus]